jgi:lipoprotein-releasing system permease protein
VGFGSHIQISNFDTNTSYESKPITKNDTVVNAVNKIKGVQHIQVYATKAGIIKTDNDIEGVVLKGIDKDFNWDFFKQKIVQGSVFNIADSVKSNAVIISKYTAKRLSLKVGDDMLTYFIQQPPRMRKFKIAGIYETGLEEFDKLFVICDIKHIQKLNDWNPNQISGYEIMIDDFNKIDEAGKEVYDALGSNLNARTIKELYPQIFDWLKLQDMNVVIIVILMILVAGINMISALLIIIMERTNMIGLLKAMGASNVSIRKVFLYSASYLTLIGLLAGNVIGLGLCFIQKSFGIIKLSQESYYLSVVPINFSFSSILLLNLGTLLVCLMMLVLPSIIITKITPVKAIRFA